MSRTSLILGLFVSLILHGLLLMTMAKTSDEVALDESGDQNQVELVQMPEDPTPEPVDEPAQEEVAAAEPPASREQIAEASPSPSESSAAIHPDRLIDPPGSELDTESLADGDFAAEDVPDDALPMLQIVWEGPDHVRNMARRYGMRIIAMSSDQEIVGEISRRGPLSIDPVGQPLRGYSNRVRTLPPGYFGSEIARRSETAISSYFIFVPSALDQSFMDHQRESLNVVRLDAREVRLMEGRLSSSGPVRQPIQISRIVTTSGKEHTP